LNEEKAAIRKNYQEKKETSRKGVNGVWTSINGKPKKNFLGRNHEKKKLNSAALQKKKRQKRPPEKFSRKGRTKVPAKPEVLQ